VDPSQISEETTNMTIDTRRSLLLPALLAAAAVVAACSSGGGATAAPSVAAPSVAPSEAPASEAPASEAPASEAPAAAVELAVADSSLGQIIVDGEGKTLYMFQPDEAGTPTCYDECAANWPPLLADDPASVTVGTGLDASKLSVVDRTDGGKQLKYGNWTLYYFANDAAAGDVNGQGINEVWYVLAPSGEPIKG
jgi:predicted lipoprotein with Yx(FWY)xxD motif